MKELKNGRQLNDDNLDNVTGGKMDLDDPWEIEVICPHCHVFVKQSRFQDHFANCPKRQKDK